MQSRRIRLSISTGKFPFAKTQLWAIEAISKAKPQSWTGKNFWKPLKNDTNLFKSSQSHDIQRCIGSMPCWFQSKKHKFEQVALRTNGWIAKWIRSHQSPTFIAGQQTAVWGKASLKIRTDTQKHRSQTLLNQIHRERERDSRLLYLATQEIELD